MRNNQRIFVCLHEEGYMFAATKEEVDNRIKKFEEEGEEVDFTTIAETKGVIPNMLEISERNIEFFDKEKSHEKAYTDKAILSIINYVKFK